jgi:hypothetical protein
VIRWTTITEYIFSKTEIRNGHAFIELGSPTGTTYYELNTNPLFAGTGILKLLSNLQDNSGAFIPAPGHPELWDGKINKTQTLSDFLAHLDGNKHVASAQMEISGFQFLDMQNYADQRMLQYGGFADYGLFGSSCITLVNDILKAGGVQTPLSSLFTSIDMLITGDTWVWYHGLLLDVPRPGASGPTALDAITKFAGEIGFLPPDKTPVMSVAAGEIEQWLGRPFDHTKADFDQIKFGLANGILPASIDFVSTTGNERYLASFDNTFDNRFVFSGDQNGLALSTVTAGFLQHITAFPANGMQIDQAFAPNGILIEKKTDLAGQFDWDRQITISIDNKPVNKIVINDDNQVASTTWNGAEVAGNIGAFFGSKLGTYLGGNSLVAQLGAGTVMGAIGKEVGKALFMGGTFTLETSIQNAFGTLAGGSGVGSLPSAAIATISSLLMSELADTLNLSGFEGGLFQTVGTPITTKLITNAFGMMTGATWGNGNAYTMFTGFNSDVIVPEIGGVVGGYLGSTLAGHIVIPHYAEGAIGQQIGSAVGGMLGNAFVPVIGGFVGALIGSIAGSIAGDLAGNDPESHGRVVFYTDNRFHPDPNSFWGDHGANGDLFMHIATYTGNAVNALADFAGVQMHATPVTTPLAVNPSGLQLLYTQDNHYFMINEPFQGPLSVVAYPDSDDDLSPLINKGIMTLAHRVALTGGDPLVRLAAARRHQAERTERGIARIPHSSSSRRCGLHAARAAA